MKNVFIIMRNIEEGKNNLKFLFTDQYKPPLKTKPKGIKGYDKAHKTQYRIKLLEHIGSIICCTEANLQGTWATMKADERLYMFFRRSNKKMITI